MTPEINAQIDALSPVRQSLIREALHLIEKANDSGFDLTITLEPNEPLAMGYHHPRIGVTPKNSLYRGRVAYHVVDNEK